jgi:murein DD-endopeptidase MepM/ murein hydrolase activator NlpD
MRNRIAIQMNLGRKSRLIFWVFALIMALGATIQNGYPQGNSFYLRFPLQPPGASSPTAYSPPLINSVMDHDMVSQYAYNEKAAAFTGEVGLPAYGEPAGCSNPPTNTRRCAYKNFAGIPFFTNGAYRSADGVRFLDYDDHPGIDYHADCGTTNVYAAVSGTVQYPANIPGISNAYTFHVLEIDTDSPNDAYKIYYLHLATHPKWQSYPSCSGQPELVPAGQHVNAGDLVAIVGDAGVQGSPHLHFEVQKNDIPVDPYGWQGQYPDPRGDGSSTNLWKPLAFASAAVRWHPDGTLITADGTSIYFIQAGQKRGIPTQTIFYAYGYEYANVITVSQQEFACIANGPDLASPTNTAESPRLRSDNGTTYEITDLSFKRAFPSPQVFLGQGFRWSDVQNSSVAGIADDLQIPIYNSPFREGTLIKAQDMAPVYIISNSQKREFDSPSTLQALGYRLGDVIVTDSATASGIPTGDGITALLVTACATNTTAGPPGGNVWSLAIDPSNPATLYAGTVGGVFKSTNGGSSWTATNSSPTNVNALTIDPLTPDTLYAGTQGLGLGTGIFKSTDGGTSWVTINSGLTTLFVVALAIDPSSPATLYAGTNGRGVFKSTNGGMSWNEVNSGLTNTTVPALAIDSSAPATLYAGTYNSGGIFKSTNGGTSWTPSGLTGLIFNALAIDTSNPGTLYAGSFGGGVFKSTNGGSSWNAVNSGLTSLLVNALAIDPSMPSTLYAGTYNSGGIFKSTNGGTSWNAVNSGLPATQVYALAIDPGNPATLYSGTLQEAFKSTDSAVTWHPTGTSSGNGAPPAAAIPKISGDNQIGTAGQPLRYPLVAVVTNFSGIPVAGVTVNFAVPFGGAAFSVPQIINSGTLSANKATAQGEILSATQVTTDSQGVAMVTVTLGPNTGTTTVIATADGLIGSPLTFTATATELKKRRGQLTSE